MKAAFWAASDDGSSWYRCEQPANALRWLGHTVWASEVLPPSQQTYADVIIGSRIANPAATLTWKRLHDAGKRLVLDLDDDYFHIDPANRQAYGFWTEDGRLDTLAANLALADRVTCVSETLAKVLREYASDVRVVPNGLHASLLSAPRTYTTDRIRVGWSGTASTWPGLPLIARAVNRIVDYRPDMNLQVVFIGATPAVLHDAGIHPHPRIRTVEWVYPNDRYLRAVMGFDLWLAPYQDSLFNRAKAATKALEAGFLGIPLIASGITPYQEWITPGVDGFLAVQDHEWGRHLKALIDDPGLRERIGRAGRAKASRYVLQHLGQAWEQALS